MVSHCHQGKSLVGVLHVAESHQCGAGKKNDDAGEQEASKDVRTGFVGLAIRNRLSCWFESEPVTDGDQAPGASIPFQERQWHG